MLKETEWIRLREREHLFVIEADKTAAEIRHDFAHESGLAHLAGTLDRNDAGVFQGLSYAWSSMPLDPVHTETILEFGGFAVFYWSIRSIFLVDLQAGQTDQGVRC